MTDLGTLGGSYSFPSDINDRGQIVGYSTTASDEIHGFVWQNSTMMDMGTLGGTYSSARAKINLDRLWDRAIRHLAKSMPFSGPRRIKSK
jgi:probable HAF family extracellular repeat protein